MTPRRSSRRHTALGLAALLAAGSALAPAALAQRAAGNVPAARAEADGPAWASLTPAQQAALAPLKRDWPSIDAARKEKWLELAGRFPSMPEPERRRVQERMTEWAHLSPEERGRARLQYQEARSVKPQERREQWDAYQTLPPEQKRALANRSQSVPGVAPAGNGKPSPGQKAPGATPPARDKAAGLAAEPAVVQGKPGASTTLISNAPVPAKSKPAPSKMGASPGRVNRTTLLPQNAPPAASAARERQ
jgi:hypothetical protein